MTILALVPIAIPTTVLTATTIPTVAMVVIMMIDMTMIVEEIGHLSDDGGDGTGGNLNE
jgi:hypothetical protein